MTGERRTPWRVDNRRLQELIFNLQRHPGANADRYLPALLDLAELRALAVSAVNARGDAEGAEPVPAWWQYRYRKSVDTPWSSWHVVKRREVAIVKAGEFGEVEALYAAPVAIRPEPAGEVEWRWQPHEAWQGRSGQMSERRVSELYSGMGYNAGNTRKARDVLIEALDAYVSARTALARRPGGGQSRDIASALDDALHCLEGDTPEDMTRAEARSLTIEKVRTALRSLPAPPDADTPDNRERRRPEGGGR